MKSRRIKVSSPKLRASAGPPRFMDSAKASVMVLVRGALDPFIVLTERTAHLSSHAGEVAWPGGRVGLPT